MIDFNKRKLPAGIQSFKVFRTEDMDISLEHFDNCYIDSTTLETSDVGNGGAELFLYQSGYLTIKGYEDDVYTLGFPNEEVKQVIGLGIELDEEGKGLLDWKII